MPSIAQITTFYENMGGVERSVKDLSIGLLEREFDVTVLCTRKNESRTYTEDGISVIASGSPVSIAGRPLALGLAKELGRGRYDLKHFHLPCPLATVAQQVCRNDSSVKIVSWHHGIGKYPLFEAAYRPALRQFLKTVDRIMVTAPSMISFSNVLEEFADKCSVVPLGIDTGNLEQVDHNLAHATRQKFSRPIILFVGRLVYYKGCDVLIKAMREIDGDLLIAGDGPLREVFMRLSAECGVNDKVHFMGRVSDNELATLYHACDLFVLPSVSPTECFGLVQVEAMASGKPVINTNLPTGVPWVSPHEETGLTVPPNDVEALSKSINLLLSNKPMRLRLGEAAKARAYAHFTISRQVENTVAIYSEVLSAVKPNKRKAIASAVR